jgi:outer membrane protein TolC
VTARNPLTLAMLLSCAFCSPAAAKKYTLTELLARVRSDYPGVVAARQGVEIARGQERTAARAWAPWGTLDGVAFGAGINRCAGFGQDVDLSLPQAVRERNCHHLGFVSALATGNNILDQFPVFGVSLGLYVFLQQPLYSFGRIEAGLAQARAWIETAREYERIYTQDALMNATRAYWAIKAARAARDTLSEVDEKLKEWIERVIKEMEEQNKNNYTEADLARLKTALDTVTLTELDIERNLLYAEEGLRVLADDDRADVDDEELSLLDIVPRPLDWFEDAARVHRPEARLLTANVNSVHGMRMQRRAELLPELALQNRFQFQWQSSADSPHNAFMARPNQGNGTWNLLFHLPLDLPLRAARLEQARADEETAKLRRKQSLGDFAVDVARAFADHEEARLREERLGHAEKVARGWYTIVDQNMSQGLTASTDARELTDSARTYFDYRIRRLQAIMDANVTWAALQRATGSP